MALQKQARDIMNTQIRNSGSPEGMVRVFDSETGVMHDAAAVQDRAAYHRFLVLCARLTGSREERPQEAPAEPGKPLTSRQRT